MIIDVHSHFWEYPRDFTADFREQAKRAKGGTEFDLTVRYEDYRAACGPDVRTVVFGGKAKLSGVWVDDRHVAGYVAQHPDTLIGFLSVDPTQPGWEKELRDGHGSLRLRGIKLLPMYAGFRLTTSTRTALEACRPVPAPRAPPHRHDVREPGPLECTLPHLDAVARRHGREANPAHLGHPRG